MYVDEDLFFVDDEPVKKWFDNHKYGWVTIIASTLHLGESNTRRNLNDLARIGYLEDLGMKIHNGTRVHMFRKKDP